MEGGLRGWFGEGLGWGRAGLGKGWVEEGLGLGKGKFGLSKDD